MQIPFDIGAKHDANIQTEVNQFLAEVKTHEQESNSPITIYQDGKKGSYYVKCTIPANVVCNLLDLNARLDPINDASYRANRELLLKHHTYQRMRTDAEKGREFHDIIVEYSKAYNLQKPLKVWGGQHRSKAIQEALEVKGVSRYHGFRVYFGLSKEQRTDLALISNTNILVSNDLFDRQLEETLVGTQLREWCVRVGLLNQGEDFPDQASRSERISVQLARSFMVNFFHGKAEGAKLKEGELDRHVYEPYLCQSGAFLDPEYEEVICQFGGDIWDNPRLIEAGKAFAQLYQTQRDAVEKYKKIENRKGFRNKALTASVLAGWSFIAGLLQSHPQRLNNLFQIPKSTKECPDPLNAKGMSTFHHQQDESTYRGLGTRSSIKDRQRMAQVFLAKSTSLDMYLDKGLLDQAVSQVIAIKAWQRGYAPL